MPNIGPTEIIIILLIPLALRGVPYRALGAAALAGAFLITPRAYVYDAPMVAIAAAFLAREMVARGAGVASGIKRCSRCISLIDNRSYIFWIRS